jgi:hypothetical protein
LAAWKQKQAQAQEAKMKEAAATGGVNILQEMDNRARRSSPIPTASPASPVVALTPGSGGNSPVVRTTKFDPKAIIKKATSHHTTQAALGIDVAVPTSGSKPFANSSSVKKGLPKANIAKTAVAGDSTGSFTQLPHHLTSNFFC